MPDQIFGGYLRPDIPQDLGPISRWVNLNQARAKASEKASKSSHEFQRNLAIYRVHFHGHIGIGHHRHVANRSHIFHIHRHVCFFDFFRAPIARRRQGFCAASHSWLNSISKKPLSHLVGWVVHAPSKATGYGIPSDTCFVRIGPTQALFLYRGSFRDRNLKYWHRRYHGFCLRYALRPSGLRFLRRPWPYGQMFRVPGQRSFRWIGFSIHPFRIHINQAHLYGCQWIFHCFWLIYILIAFIAWC